MFDLHFTSGSMVNYAILLYMVLWCQNLATDEQLQNLDDGGKIGSYHLLSIGPRTPQGSSYYGN